MSPTPKPAQWKRLICQLRGHAWRQVPLPEFLYPDQHFKCRRCGLTFGAWRRATQGWVGKR